MFQERRNKKKNIILCCLNFNHCITKFVTITVATKNLSYYYYCDYFRNKLQKKYVRKLLAIKMSSSGMYLTYHILECTILQGWYISHTFLWVVDDPWPIIACWHDSSPLGKKDGYPLAENLRKSFMASQINGAF